MTTTLLDIIYTSCNYTTSHLRHFCCSSSGSTRYLDLNFVSKQFQMNNWKGSCWAIKKIILVDSLIIMWSIFHIFTRILYLRRDLAIQIAYKFEQNSNITLPLKSNNLTMILDIYILHNSKVYGSQTVKFGGAVLEYWTPPGHYSDLVLPGCIQGKTVDINYTSRNYKTFHH